MHNCIYCGFENSNLNIIKEHEEDMHGCFRDINPRLPETKERKNHIYVDEVDKVPHLFKKGIQIDVYCYYDDSLQRTVFYTDSLKYGKRVELKINDNGLLCIPNLNELRQVWNEKHDVIGDVYNKRSDD